MLAFALTFVIGFERELRGSPAGDRTFSLIGVGSALIGVLASQAGALSILSGAVTGVGFLGAGLLFRQQDQPLGTMHGVTTAATIIGAAGIGAAAGEGQVWLCCVATTLMLLVLEIRYIPGLRVLDARRWSHKFRSDSDPHHRGILSGTGPHVPDQREGEGDSMVERTNEAQIVAVEEAAAEEAIAVEVAESMPSH